MTPIKIFIDTSFIIALINERDQYHNQALSLADQYDTQLLVVTDSVLLEVANALSRRYKFEAIQVIEDLLTSEDVEVVRLTPELFDRAFQLYKTRQDKAWGLVDCISFIVMQDRGISIAFTFDQHFAQAGFQILPSTK
ncbi:MAG: PIN domain-containing protein [Tychonema bourrellyi B0820]|uniref:PIN domain-containing protein n=1 Tax=Tychonema bourrellyi FEM_GT703 TaxID=2040638 RepID=A0A2G4EXW4_9CYAN|nr:PIN domain-containing protein [Tychonema bourrellyi]MDQ2099873.1 PIN domain-containing protein [Tychonema bourrellyi B0820]PHX54318.1 PIN domain-containing protein [Tychonema bourrellyi FEM_GT703]